MKDPDDSYHDFKGGRSGCYP